MELEINSEIEKALSTIRGCLEMMSPQQTPFDDSSLDFNNGVFAVAAFRWGEEQSWNFKWRDFEVSWRGYFAREAKVNRELSEREIRAMLDECVYSLIQIHNKSKRKI